MNRAFRPSRIDRPAYFYLVLVLAVVLTPRIPLMPLGFGDLSLRVDGLGSAIAGLLALFILTRNLGLAFLAILLMILYLRDINTALVSMGLYLQIFSIILLPFILLKLAKVHTGFSEWAVAKIERFLTAYAVFNVGLAFFSRLIEFEYCFDAENMTGCVGPYGLLDRPYIFAVFVGCALVVASGVRRINFPVLLILVFGCSISDSRAISVILLLVAIFSLYTFHRELFVKILTLLFALIIILILAAPSGSKMSFGGAPNEDGDPSWLMRLYNIDLYVQWLDSYKFIFGAGGLAFYQFSDAYGAPGPVDNLYIRLGSEIGVLGFIVLFYIFLNPLVRWKQTQISPLLISTFIVAVLSISIFHESLIVPRAGHLISALGSYICLKQYINSRRLDNSRRTREIRHLQSTI